MEGEVDEEDEEDDEAAATAVEVVIADMVRVVGLLAVDVARVAAGFVLEIPKS